MDELNQIIFLGEFFQDVGEFDTIVLEVGKMGLEVDFLISKL